MSAAKAAGSEKPILLIGGHGMLGRAWQQSLVRSGIPFQAPSRKELDLLEVDDVNQWLDGSQAIVVNCAAWTDVDRAEEEEKQATQMNGEAVGRLAQRCREVGALLVHYSTDYVFNGQANKPYRIDEPRDPLNAYGRSKARGEELIECSGCEHITIRTSWLYAPWGHNFVLTMMRLMNEKPELQVVDDQRGRPTSVTHLASMSMALIQHHARGIHHVTDGGECTWYEFASEIRRYMQAECRVAPCTSEQFPRPARRPAYSVLDLTQTERLLGAMPAWQDNLRAVLQESCPADTPQESL